MTGLQDFLASFNTEGAIDSLKQANESFKEYQILCLALRKQNIREGLQALDQKVSEKADEYYLSFTTYENKDLAITYYRSRRDHYEQQVQSEAKSAQLEEIWNEFPVQESRVDELSRTSLSEKRILDYYFNREIAAALRDQIKSYEGMIQLTRLFQNIKPSPLLSAKQPAPVPQAKQVKESNDGTKEAIFKRLQGLPPEQQLVTAAEVRIIMGGISVSTFHERKKEKGFPEPVRMLGKGRKAYFRLDDVLRCMTTTREKRSFSKSHR